VFVAEARGAAALFEQHHEALYRYLARYTGDSDLAADITQETFVRYLERPPAPEISAPWLFRVATNLARDASRSVRRHRELATSGRIARSYSDPPLPPDRAVERAEADALVKRALTALSEKERMALLMREEGFAHREIADALGTTTGSVGTLLARALRKMAHELGYQEEEA
jgi:RNA polymerase sigma factor (sigma-70 family)